MPGLLFLLFFVDAGLCGWNVYYAVDGQHPLNVAVAVFCGLGALFQLSLAVKAVD